MLDDNQDFQSYSMQKNEPVSNRWVKLKFLKDERFKDQIMTKDMVRVCEVCNKVFSSGKALGGHMRIHFQQATYKKDLLISKKKSVKSKKQNSREFRVYSEDLIKSNIGFVDHMNMDHKPVCAICGRDFPSMKSLFGHLRCHPDRAWRGLQPPQSGNENCASSFSSSSSLLDADLSSDIEDHVKINEFDYAGEKGSVSLPELLSGGWMVTGRRGRKATVVGSTSEASSSEEDELLYNAACDLMMMSCDLITRNENKVGEVEAAKTIIIDMDSVLKFKSKRKIDEISEKNVGGHLKNRKKIRKVVKLCDLDRVDENGSTPLNHKVGVATGDNYRCNTCDKSFPTYQALGGHKSSHNRIVKVVVQNSVIIKPRTPVEEKEKLEKDGVYLSTDGPCPWSQVVSPSDSCETFRRRLDLDLNDKLPSDDEVGVGRISS